MPYSKAPSAKILANRAAKVVMNRAALDDAVLGMADSLLMVGQQIVDDASKGPGGSGVGSLRDPELAAKEGRPMMLDTGILGVWAAGKKIGGGMVSKPRVTKVVESKTIPGTFRSVRRVASTPRNEAVLFVGFASPLAHFAELGTIKEPARPFLTPALNRNLGTLGASLVVPAMGKRISGRIALDTRFTG
jgi:hypothetical protein